MNNIMNRVVLDISQKEVGVDDQIFYATTHGNLQIGRVIEVMEDGSIKVIGKGNKRELKIANPQNQVALKAKGYYITRKLRKAWN